MNNSRVERVDRVEIGRRVDFSRVEGEKGRRDGRVEHVETCRGGMFVAV